jgi:phosphoglycolate phosphatase
MSNTTYPLLIFDWDGTLMDSAARIVSCLRIAAGEAGLPERDDKQFRHVIGLGIHEAIDYLFAGAIDDTRRDRFIEVYRDQFVSLNRTPSALFEGVPAMLDALRARGHDLAIATGKSRAGLDRVLRDQGLEAYFPVSRCADESGSKPDPAMLHEILVDYDLPAERALMIGDTEFDIAMAHNAGMAAVAVSHGAHTVEQLERAGALTILRDVRLLPDWLASQPALAC